MASFNLDLWGFFSQLHSLKIQLELSLLDPFFVPHERIESNTKPLPLPPKILRQSSVTPTFVARYETESKGEKVHLLLRLGLLRLVSEAGGLTVEILSETFKLNFLRLRDVQSQLQKVIVISSRYVNSTKKHVIFAPENGILYYEVNEVKQIPNNIQVVYRSILVLRQTLLSDRLLSSPADMEDIISESVKRLSELLDSSEDVGVLEMVEIMNYFSEGGDLEKWQSRKELMANLLAKSLREGDVVFTQVSCAVYLAARGLVHAGNGMKGKQLAEAMLKCIGASHLTEKLVEAVEELVMMTNLPASIHRARYEQISYSMH